MESREEEPSLELPVVEAFPEAPDWFPNVFAVNEWNRLAPILKANNLLTVVSLDPLAQLCALHGRIVQLYMAGTAPTAAMLGQYRVFCSDFGMTPIAQLKIPCNKPPKNKFSRSGEWPL